MRCLIRDVEILLMVSFHIAISQDHITIGNSTSCSTVTASSTWDNPYFLALSRTCWASYSRHLTYVSAPRLFPGWILSNCMIQVEWSRFLTGAVQIPGIASVIILSSTSLLCNLHSEWYSSWTEIWSSVESMLMVRVGAWLELYSSECIKEEWRVWDLEGKLVTLVQMPIEIVCSKYSRGKQVLYTFSGRTFWLELATIKATRIYFLHSFLMRKRHTQGSKQTRKWDVSCR